MGSEVQLLIICFCFCQCFFFLFSSRDYGRAYLPAMSKACKYTYLEKDDRVKSSQVTSDILS